MIADTTSGLGPRPPSPQHHHASQRKLAFKRYVDALAQGDEDEAADVLANWQRLTGASGIGIVDTGKGGPS